MTILELNVEHRVGQRLENLTLELDCVLFAHCATFSSTHDTATEHHNKNPCHVYEARVLHKILIEVAL